MKTLDKKDTDNFLGQNANAILKDLREYSLSEEDLTHLLEAEQTDKNRAKVIDALQTRLSTKLETETPKVPEGLPAKKFDREPSKNCACPKCGYLEKADEPGTCPECGTQMVYR